MVDKVTKSDAEWRAQLTPEQYKVARKKGTERAFSGEYWDNHDEGTVSLRLLRHASVRAETKFDSGTGWPSFYAPVSPENVRNVDDASWFMRRTEVVCAACDAHLGHVFEDGPKPTGPAVLHELGGAQVRAQGLTLVPARFRSASARNAGRGARPDSLHASFTRCACSSPKTTG
jgi:peptide-methionine (R)-S-oxide reductase